MQTVYPDVPPCRVNASSVLCGSHISQLRLCFPLLCKQYSRLLLLLMSTPTLSTTCFNGTLHDLLLSVSLFLRVAALFIVPPSAPRHSLTDIDLTAPIPNRRRLHRTKEEEEEKEEEEAKEPTLEEQVTGEYGGSGSTVYIHMGGMWVRTEFEESNEDSCGQFVLRSGAECSIINPTRYDEKRKDR